MSDTELLKNHNKMILEMIEKGIIKGELADEIRQDNKSVEIKATTQNELADASAEMLELLKYFREEDLKKIPKGFIDRLKQNANPNYEPKLDSSKRLLEQELKEKTKVIISILFRNYLCTEEDKKVVDKILNKNEEIYQENLKKQYNSNNIF